MKISLPTKAPALSIALAALGIGWSGPAAAQAPALLKDCASEIATYCKAVTPGADRVVACLVAYEDKISARCRLTAYMSTGELDVRLAGLRKMAKICSADTLQYCSTVQPGGGRIFDCLKKNKATLNDECRQGLPAFEKLMLD